jgi:hypothetical protein
VRVDGRWNTLCAFFHQDDHVRVLDGTARCSEPSVPHPLSRPPRSTSKSSSIRRRSISPAKEWICNIGGESMRYVTPLSPFPDGRWRDVGIVVALFIRARSTPTRAARAPPFAAGLGPPTASVSTPSELLADHLPAVVGFRGPPRFLLGTERTRPSLFFHQVSALAL